MKKQILVLIAITSIGYSNAQVNPTDTLKTKPDTVITPPPPPPPPAPPPPLAPPPAPPKTTEAPKQRRDTRPFKERVDLGFGSSFWITPSQTYVEIAPVLAYRFPKILITGIGYRYIYRHERVLNNDLNSYGPNVFARANLTKRIYLWTEYEILKNQYYDDNYINNEQSKETNTIDSWFAGIGYVKSFGRKGRGGLSVQVLYNFLYQDDDYNPYYSPVTYRVGYFF